MKGAGKILKVLGLILYSMAASAQVDPHFSQYYANPLWLNPGMTGIIDGDYRASASFKDQWGSVADSYRTAGAFFDIAPVKRLAFGVSIINQSAGELDFNYFNALVSGAYRVRLGRDGLQILNFGLQAGVLNNSFDISGAKFGEQFDPAMGHNPSIPSTENLSGESSTMFDVNAGVMFFDGNPLASVNVFGGAAVSHINRPVNKLFSNNSKIPMRYNIHGGATVKVSEYFTLTPNVLYLEQGTANEIAGGVYARLLMSDRSDLLFGGTARHKDAAIAFAGFHYSDFVLGVSYDFNTSTLQRASGGLGGIELSLSFTPRKGIMGPSFFCPRL